MSAFGANLWKGFVNLFAPGLGSLLFNGDGSIFTNGFNNISNAVSQFGELGYDISQGNMLGNYLSKMTGSRLTDAEREANAWNEKQVLSAWDRTLEADNTKYQRQVADMQAAGLNPMLAAGGSVSSPHSVVASSVSPSAATFGLDSILNMIKLGREMSNIEADTENKRADAAKKVSETKGQDIVNNFEEEARRLHNEGLGIANSLNRRQLSLMAKQIDDIDASIELKIQQSKSEVERRSLYSAQSVLARASAHQIAELLPYSKALSDAQTSQARANAAFAAAQAAYQNGLLSSGMIEAQVHKIVSEDKSISESARYTKIKADVANIEKSLREGHTPENWDPESGAGMIVSIVYALLEMINPLSKMINPLSKLGL